MVKKVYHGSEKEIKAPVYGFGKKYNDYGLGFYCTEELDLAKEWAVDLNRDGYANAYEIETDDLIMIILSVIRPRRICSDVIILRCWTIWV